MRQDERTTEEQQRERRIQKAKKRQKRKGKTQILIRFLWVTVFFVVLILAAVLIQKIMQKQNRPMFRAAVEKKKVTEAPDFSVELLTPNEYSRPQTALEQVNGIVIHYTANPGTTAEQNRSYFEGLAQVKKTYASSHFIIGISGEIIQCIPCDEVAYASNERNGDTISIECCIPDETGKFTQETYNSLVKLTAWLMGRYDLAISDVIRHYDVTGKDCPKYFVENRTAWQKFRETVVGYIETNGIEKTQEIN